MGAGVLKTGGTTLLWLASIPTGLFIPLVALHAGNALYKGVINSDHHKDSSIAKPNESKINNGKSLTEEDIIKEFEKNINDSENKGFSAEKRNPLEKDERKNVYENAAKGDVPFHPSGLSPGKLPKNARTVTVNSDKKKIDFATDKENYISKKAIDANISTAKMNKEDSLIKEKEAAKVEKNLKFEDKVDIWVKEDEFIEMDLNTFEKANLDKPNMPSFKNRLDDLKKKDSLTPKEFTQCAQMLYVIAGESKNANDKSRPAISGTAVLSIITKCFEEGHEISIMKEKVMEKIYENGAITKEKVSELGELKKKQSAKMKEFETSAEKLFALKKETTAVRAFEKNASKIKGGEETEEQKLAKVEYEKNLKLVELPRAEYKAINEELYNINVEVGNIEGPLVVVNALFANIDFQELAKKNLKVDQGNIEIKTRVQAPESGILRKPQDIE